MTHDHDHPTYKVISLSCSGGKCPTVYEDGDDLLIQGYAAEDLFTKDYLPTGESVVRIPRSLLSQIASTL